MAHAFGTASSKQQRLPCHHKDAARGIIRQALQQLAKLKVVRKHKNGQVIEFSFFHSYLQISGRVLTNTGRRDLDRIATHIAGERRKHKAKAKK